MGNVYGRHIVSRRFLLPALALGVVTFSGCGPVEYVAQVGSRASNALAQARREKADQLAPYEYTAAGEYLKKAREEAGRSQFEAALDYGKRAEELADRARALSRERKAGRGWDDPTRQAPSPRDAEGGGGEESGAPARRAPRGEENEASSGDGWDGPARERTS